MNEWFKINSCIPEEQFMVGTAGKGKHLGGKHLIET